MAQTRITNYGDNFTHALFSTWTKTLLPSGRYEGLEFVYIAPNQFALSPGSFLLPDGILVTEDANIVFPPIVPLPAIATTYEVRVSHVDETIIGGNPADYSFVPASTPYPTDPGMVTMVLGTLQYPGSLSPLAANQYTPAPTQQGASALALGLAQQPIQIVPPYPMCLDIGSPNITVTDGRTGTLFRRRLTASALVPAVVGELRVFAFQWISKGLRPDSISLRADFPSNDTLAFELWDTNSNLVSLTNGGPTSGSGSYARYTATVNRDGTVFAVDQPFTLYVGCNLQASTVMDLFDLTVRFGSTS